MQSLASCQLATRVTARLPAARRQAPAEAAQCSTQRAGGLGPSRLRLQGADGAQGRRRVELRATPPVANALGSTSDDDEDDDSTDRRRAAGSTTTRYGAPPPAVARICMPVPLVGTDVFRPSFGVTAPTGSPEPRPRGTGGGG